MKIRVNPHNVEIVREETEPINELEVKVSKCEFEFDEKITNEFVKEAYFTLNGSTYKQIIVNNECDYPNEVLTQTGTLEVGVVAYKVENGEELIRYNPSPDYYDTWVGSLKDAENTEPLTPTDKEQMQSQISQNTSDISDLQANKQDKLTAGDNITIDENNVISATDTIYDDTEIKTDIQELQETKIHKDVNNLTYYTLTTETGSKITLSIDSSTYVMTLKLKDKNNNDISTANVDLPLETMVVGARYDSATKEIILTLKNGQEVRFSVADLVSGLQTEITENNKLSSDLVDDTNNTNKFVSASEKEQITTNKNDITAIKDGQNIDSFSDVETELGLKEDNSNKVTEINSSSTDTQYPSAKCVYDSQEEQNEKIAELEMLYNAFPTVSAEDTTIQLDNTAKVKFREIDLKGNTSQVVIPEEQGTSVSNTSIYVSDVDTDKEHTIEMSGNTYQYSTSGINVYNVNNGGNISPEITIDNNYYVNCTYNNTSGTTWHYSNFMINKTDMIQPSTNYLIVAEIKSVSGSGRFYPFTQHLNGCIQTVHTYYEFSSLLAGQKILIPVTTKSSFTTDTKYDLRTLVSYEAGSSGTITFRLSILSDTTITADTFVYQPFTNGASPNPSYPQNIEVVTGQNDIEVCGKNLFNKNNMALNEYIRDDGTTLSSDYWDITHYIRIMPIETFTYNGLTTVGTSVVQSAYYDKNKNFISVFKQATGTNTITPPANAYYVRFSINKGSNDKDTFMLEKGSTTSTYEAYQGTTYPVNLGNIELCKISTYRDRIYKRNNKWYLEKNVGKATLTGNEPVIRKATSATGYYSFSIDIGTNIYATDTTQEDAPFYCNKFVSGSRSKAWYLQNCIYPTNTTFSYSSFGFYYDATKEMTTQQFQNWLSQNGIVVYYPYATPTTTEITDSTLVNQLNALYNATIYPITNINTDTSNLLPYIDLHYNFVTPSPSPSRPSVVNVVKGNNTITISNSNNTESQNYPINLGDMELCKIGIYQDYIYESNGNWFKKSNINKLDMSTITSWGGNNNYQFYRTNFVNAYGISIGQVYSNVFLYDSTSWAGTYQFGISNNGSLWIQLPTTSEETKDTIANYLGTINAIMYGILATPTDTQITDTTLITQLNNIKKAYSYDTQTNISQTNTDKPFIIYAEAIRSLKDVFE